MPAKLRLTIELDLTSPHVEGQRYDQLTYALAQLTRLIESDDLDDLPELYPDLDQERAGWTQRPLQVQTSREGLVTIGSFEIATIPTLPLTAQLNSAKDA